VIATVLNALGLGDDLPRSHVERAADLAARQAKIESDRATEHERLTVAIAAAQRKAASDTAAEQERFDAHALQLADALAADVVAELVPTFEAWCAEPSRKIAGDAAAKLRALDARSVEELGRALTPWLVCAGAAKALVDAKGENISAFVAPEAFHEPVLGCAGRLLRAALGEAEPVTLEAYMRELEAALAKRVQSHAGRTCSAEERQQWAAIIGSGRDSDRATKLTACAEHYGKLRQSAFEAAYTPADHVIVSHTHRFESHAE
jgi:hypothetical protein